MSKTTTVVRVNGQSPDEWTKSESQFYVGRFYYLRSGKYSGQSWPNSGFGNPHRLPDEASRSEKIDVMYRYIISLAASLTTSELLAKQFFKLHGMKLGCWCIDLNGSDPLPQCHACWLAKLVDMSSQWWFRGDERGVLITPDGKFSLCDESKFGDKGIWIRPRIDLQQVRYRKSSSRVIA